nr:ribonuclease E/G [Desulfobacteraceae bacterium]
MNENKTNETTAFHETEGGRENPTSFLKSAAEKLLGLSRKGRKTEAAPAPEAAASAPVGQATHVSRPEVQAVAASTAPAENPGEGIATPQPESSGGKGRSRSRGRRRKSAAQRQAAARKEGGEQTPQEEKPAPEKEPPPEAAAPPKSGARKGRKRGKKPAPPKGEQPAEGQAEPTAALKLLINSDEPEECRIVLLEKGRVESLHIETVSRESTKGNIYKGRITAVEPNLQAAFVDIGTVKNGFLPFAEIHPEYYSREVEEGRHWKDMAIQEVIARGQEVLVQVVKEATGGKGANMTTYLSMPGRNLVLMPGSDSAGISRKIEDEAQRARLREMVATLKLPEGIGYIIRTASADITKTALASDAKYLLNLWEEIKKRGQTMPAPSLIYKEQNIIARFLRDHFTADIEEIVVDTQEAFDQVQHFLELLPPKQRTARVRLHHGSQPLF